MKTGTVLSIGHGKEYQIIGALQGQSVYRAVDLRTGAGKCIKRYPFDTTYADSMLPKFSREVEMMDRLASCPNACIPEAIYRQSVEGYTVFPLLTGMNLEQMLKRDGAVQAKQIVPILKQLEAALTYMHALGISHRDIKPENVFLSNRPRSRSKNLGNKNCTLLDFNIAEHPELPRLALPGYFVGTPAYAAPETVSGIHSLKPRVDVYSLSASVFEAVTGSLPHPQTHFRDLQAAITSGSAPIARNVNPNVSQAVSDVLEKGLHKTPTNRYQSVAEFVEEFSVTATQ